MTDQAGPGSGSPDFNAPSGPPPAPGGSPPPPPPPPPSGWTGGSVPPPPPPPPPAFNSRSRGGSLWLGVAIGLGVSGLIYGLYATLRGTMDARSGEWFDVLAIYWPLLVGIGGIVLAAIPRTSRTGAGLLLSIGIAILAAGGLCVAVLAGYTL